MLAWAASVNMLANRHAPAGWYCSLSDAMEAACKHGRTNVVLWLLKFGCRWKGDLFDCAKKGKLAFLQWVHSNAALLASKMLPDAKRGLFWDPAMPADKYMAGAAAGGHMHILQWAMESLKPWGPHLLEIAHAAALHGQLRILKWAHSRGSFESARLCSKAAIGGHLDCLQWAHENGYPLHNGHLRFAIELAGARSLPMLQWLLQQGCRWDGWAYIEAARAGSLDVIKWAHQQGLPFPTRMRYRWEQPQPGSEQHDPMGICLPRGEFLKAAIRWGQIPVLDWAFQNGWALKHGFGKDKWACERAAGDLDLQALQWLHKHKFPLSKTAFHKAAEAYQSRHPPKRLPVLRWLRANGCPWGNCATNDAAGHVSNPRSPKNVEPLKWLIENGCPRSSKIVDSLVSRGFVGLALWVQRRGAVCKGPALAELELYTLRQQALCRCFALASKACRDSPQLEGRFSAMAAVPWELQQHMAQLAFASSSRK